MAVNFDPVKWKAEIGNVGPDSVRILRRETIYLLVAALAFLAAFILAINFYTTFKAFAHEAATRSAAFTWGFVAAGTVSAVAFGVTLYLLRSRKPTAKDSG